MPFVSPAEIIKPKASLELTNPRKHDGFLMIGLSKYLAPASDTL